MAYNEYRELVVVTQARLLTYNKWRSVEIEDITVSQCKRKLEIGDINEGLMGDVLDLEKHLVESYDLIQTSGKRGSVVPVLIPAEAKHVMKFLCDPEMRSRLNIGDSYLFANCTSRHPFRASESLKKVCEKLNLDRPQDITSTNMRKYMATLAQVMNLSDSEVDQMCRHLSHTRKVHLGHYRSMSPYLERVTLGKILLLQDKNMQNKFVGKTLDEVESALQETDFINILRDKIDDLEEVADVELSQEETEELDSYNPNEMSDTDDLPVKETNRKKINQKSKRQQWTPKNTKYCTNTLRTT